MFAPHIQKVLDFESPQKEGGPTVHACCPKLGWDWMGCFNPLRPPQSQAEHKLNGPHRGLWTQSERLQGMSVQSSIFLPY